MAQQVQKTEHATSTCVRVPLAAHTDPVTGPGIGGRARGKLRSPYGLPTLATRHRSIRHEVFD
jgi:hypothetical protein